MKTWWQTGIEDEKSPVVVHELAFGSDNTGLGASSDYTKAPNATQYFNAFS
jgi:hypothetical protein